MRGGKKTPTKKCAQGEQCEAEKDAPTKQCSQGEQSDAKDNAATKNTKVPEKCWSIDIEYDDIDIDIDKGID